MIRHTIEAPCRRPRWRAALDHESVVRVEGVRDLKGVHDHEKATCLCVEQSTLTDLDELARFSSLRELQLLACELPSLDFIPALRSLERLAIVGCSVEDASPLLSAESLKECVLRAVPWSSDSWTLDIPRLKAKAGLSSLVSTIAEWTGSGTAWRRYRVCAEPLDRRRVVLVFPGDRAEGPRGAFVVSRRPALMALTWNDDPDTLTKLAETEGRPHPAWLHDLAATPLQGGPDAIFARLEEADLPAEVRDVLRRYVERFPTLKYRHPARSPAVQELASSSAPRVLAALAEVVGPFDLGTRAEVRFSGVRDDQVWWTWHPDGAWNALDRIAGEELRLFPLALNADLERAVWVQVGPGEETPVFTGLIEEHAPGDQIDRSELTLLASDLPSLLDSIAAVRLPDGTVIPAQETD